ncbi:unnamed protein product [Rhizoctonia solani]|uniref:Uncharacterized protein n=1 Tax=Rhizoctonia solani TaxID=456999 RepID=A0A8H3CZZ7_9AGAM|nr:unnamed protein product [Rhizoctonia solani]
MTSFTDASAPTDASRSVENNSAILNHPLPSNDPDPNHIPLYTTQHFQARLASAIHEKVPFPPAKTDRAIPGGRITPLIESMPTPPVEEHIGIGTHRPPIVELMTPGSADSKFDPAGNSLVAPLTPESHHAEPEVGLGSASSTTNRVESMVNWLAYPDEDLQSDDPENIQGELLDGLVLDRQVESNLLPFIVHSFASWMSRFLFEPVRIIGITRDHIMRSYANHPTQQTMMLISNAALSVSRSTNYDLTDFMTLHTQLLKSTVEVRARINVELSREQALSAMEHSHEFISTLCRVGSFASVLNVMDLYSPIFRRACPEPGEVLVNLPRVLTTINIHLQFYATLDVLQSVLTHRPMFFRYDLDFLSPRDEELVNAEDGPGLRWLYGVPDRLMITLAKMNTLLEDFGCCVDAGRVRELEKEIEAFAPVIGSSAGTDPILNIGRVMVQESWRLAAYVYLYMVRLFTFSL